MASVSTDHLRPNLGLPPSAGHVVMRLEVEDHAQRNPQSIGDVADGGVTSQRVVAVDPEDDRPAGVGACGEPAPVHQFAVGVGQIDSAVALSWD